MHYEFLEDKVEMRGMTVFRIRALVDIPHQDVKKGDIGGFVCKYSVLSEKAWVGGNAMVWQSTLDGNIRVDNGASVEKSTLKKNCQILEDSWVFNSEVEGLYSMGESKIRESKLVMENENGSDFGFLLENDSGLKSCLMAYTAEKDEKIWLYGNAELVDCKVKGKLLEFGNNTLIKYSEIEGESLQFSDMEDVRLLKLTGEHVDFQRIKKLWEVEMKNVSQSVFIGEIHIAHSFIKGDNITMRGDGIVMEYTSILANQVSILDSVELNSVNITDSDIHLKDNVSLIGKKMERIHIGQNVNISDVVSIHIDKQKKSMSFENTSLSGDLHLTGI